MPDSPPHNSKNNLIKCFPSFLIERINRVSNYNFNSPKYATLHSL